jgi:hypothetical protein
MTLQRVLAFLAFFLFTGNSFAQTYTGTYTTKNEQGGDVVLRLKQDAKKSVTGTLSGNGNTFQVKGEAKPEGMVGTVSGANTLLYIMAKLEGPQLRVWLAEPGRDGKPNLQSAREFLLAKAGKESAPARTETASGGDQLSQLLISSPWCSFTYNQTTGSSRSERVVFHPNGVVASGSNAESYSSGPSGSVAGQTRGGGQGRWRVQSGMLHLSQDGTTWEPQNLQVTRNSSGYPIIKSGKKEYLQCR